MTSPSTQEERTCVVCGRELDSDIEPVVRPNLVGVPIAAHRSCLDAYRERIRERGDAWARSPRGRFALGWLRVRLASMIVVAAIVSIVATIPIGVMMIARSWRLRRIVRRELGTSRALVVVHTQSDVDRRAITEALGGSWAEANRLQLRFVGPKGDPGTTSDDRAIWQHWRPNRKMGAGSGIVFVPRAGGVQSWDLRSTRRDESQSDRIASVRRAIELALT